MHVNLYEIAYTRGLAEKKAHIRTHTGSQKERHVHVGKLSFGLWYLVRSVDPRYWVQGIGSTWFWTMVLREA